MEHRDIPEDGLHEPKGVSVAPPGKVYVSDGSGSGSWQDAPVKGELVAQDGQLLSKESGSIAWKDVTGSVYFCSFTQAWTGGARAVFTARDNTYSNMKINGVDFPLTSGGQVINFWESGGLARLTIEILSTVSVTGFRIYVGTSGTEVRRFGNSPDRIYSFILPITTDIMTNGISIMFFDGAAGTEVTGGRLTIERLK